MPKKKTPTRPTKMIHIRLTEETHRRLKVLVAGKGITVQEFVSKVIEEKVSR